jgi:hypothetical protein
VVGFDWLTVSAIGRDDEIGHLRRWGTRLSVAFGALIVGALPWLFANVRSGFYSLNTKAFELPANPPGYFGRLRIFFRWMLPMMFSLKAEVTGAWLFARPLSVLFFLLLLVACAAAIVLDLLRDARSRRWLSPYCCFHSFWRYHRRRGSGATGGTPTLVCRSLSWYWSQGWQKRPDACIGAKFAQPCATRLWRANCSRAGLCSCSLRSALPTLPSS